MTPPKNPIYDLASTPANPGNATLYDNVIIPTEVLKSENRLVHKEAGLKPGMSETLSTASTLEQPATQPEKDPRTLKQFLNDFQENSVDDLPFDSMIGINSLQNELAAHNVLITDLHLPENRSILTSLESLKTSLYAGGAEGDDIATLSNLIKEVKSAAPDSHTLPDHLLNKNENTPHLYEAIGPELPPRKYAENKERISTKPENIYDTIAPPSPTPNSPNTGLER